MENIISKERLYELYIIKKMSDQKISDEIVKVCMDYSETWGTIFDGSHTKAIGESGAIYYLFGAPEKTTNNTLWNEWISAMHIIGSKDATLQELILKLPKA